MKNIVKQAALKPFDVAVALLLALGGREQSPSAYSVLGDALGLSASTAHQSVARLQAAGLLLADSRQANVEALRNFLVHGVRYAFPPSVGSEVKGVPTAHAGPVLRMMFDADKPFVWPDIHGTARGTSLAPLYPKAIELPKRAPQVYAALTLVDAIRAGQARERNAAVAALDDMLAHGQ